MILIFDSKIESRGTAWMKRFSKFVIDHELRNGVDTFNVSQNLSQDRLIVFVHASDFNRTSKFKSFLAFFKRYGCPIYMVFFSGEGCNLVSFTGKLGLNENCFNVYNNINFYFVGRAFQTLEKDFLGDIKKFCDHFSALEQNVQPKWSILEGYDWKERAVNFLLNFPAAANDAYIYAHVPDNPFLDNYDKRPKDLFGEIVVAVCKLHNAIRAGASGDDILKEVETCKRLFGLNYIQ
jgi:hypothetical protein